MPKQPSLHRAKREKNDEFYTQYQDIEKEMNAYLEYNPDVFKDKTILLPCDDPEWSNFTKYFAQNFENFGIKKLISTSYAANSKPKDIPYQPTLFEIESPKFDKKKTRSHGKIFILERDINKDKKININDLEWNYLKGDGDFRSSEIKKLRNEADIIITNPPFSLFREFLAWIHDAKKQFAILGGQNAITYKEVFPLIKNGEVWLGATYSTKMYFAVPSETHRVGSESINGKNMQFLGNIRWYTNIDHGRRHQPLALMTMSDNLKFSKHKEIRKNGYRKYDNYDAIEVPFTDAIPSDYKENMGVPISFLDKHDPSQFKIIKFRKGKDGKDLTYTVSDNGDIEREREREDARLRHTSESSSEGRRCNGIMGVPISFLDKYNPNQFEIVGNEYDLNIPRGRGYVNGKRMFSRIFIKHKVQWSYGSAD